MNFKSGSILIAGSLILTIISCKAKVDPVSSAAVNLLPDSINYPFKATYSSKVVESPHPEYLQTVLHIWKLFESNKIDEMKPLYADTVKYEDASGYTFYGKSDSLLSFARKDIEGLDSLRFDISMWENIHLADRNEDWVYIWSTERRYPKNGKADTSLIHEQWRIANGKVNYFNQYKSKVPKK
jgi:hypothetical protein